MHTNKLKRKLADLGIEGNNPKLTESFCLIGTPLPPLEKTKDTGEFLPLWKQDVRDEKGRRRLHGAFTGGFSAGYFNTVGSAEGWTPSTFKSSRGERAKQKAVRPEDFMDEEDLAEIKEGQKLVDLNDEMDLSEQSGRTRDEDESLASALASLVPPSKESVGARILKKMGWKVGQGIGPKITYQQRRLQDSQTKSQSGYLPAVTADDGDEDEEAKKHMYPPRDTKLVVYERKDNSFGIGYVPGARLDGHDTKAGAKSETTGPKISTGFGLGALNDADEDDIDIYDTSKFSSSLHRRHLAFDDKDANEDEDTISLSKSQKSKPALAQRRPELKPSQLFRNGAPVLPGFVLAAVPPNENQWFHPPKVPNDWDPDPRRVWDKDKSANESQQPVAQPEKLQVHPSRAGFVKNALSADQRGAVLGETPLQAAPRSVFDYLSTKDRERLQKLSTTSLALPATTSTPQEPVEVEDTSSSTIPRLDPSVAQQALKGFQPFQQDPGKAARYNAYLRSQLDDLGTEDDASVAVRPGPYQSKETFYKELREFAKSAAIFKPVTGALGGRFASAKVVEILASGQNGLFVPGSGGAGAGYAGDQAKEEEEKQVDPMVEAAKAGMFGPLTRTIKEWSPARLLCKRFGVKEPIREEPLEDMEVGKEDWRAQLPSQDQISAMTQQQQQPGLDEELMKAATSSFRGQGRDISNIGLGDDDDQGKDVLTYVKPERDIFKAIFESDEEEEPEEEEKEVKGPTLPPPAAAMEVDTKSDAQPTPSTSLALAPYIPKDQETSTQAIDMSTFRPTFKSKTREEKGDKKDKEKKKNNKKGKAIISFGDEDGEGLVVAPAKPKKQKKDKVRTETAADDEAMWVEKAAPAITATFAVPGPSGVHVEPSQLVPKPSGRMKASDFM